jgi:hypothetical protein
VTSMVAVDAPPVKGVELLVVVRPVPSQSLLVPLCPGVGQAVVHGVAVDARRGAGQGLSRETKTIDAPGD